MKQALVLVDIQNDYFPGGKMELAGAVEASRAAKKILAHFRHRNLPVLHLQHLSIRPGATFFLPDTDGINFHESVLPLPNETVIRKHFPNSFRETILRECLMSEGVTELVICGMMSHMCVDASVRAAFDMGYSCLVAHDACATRDLLFNGLAIPSKYVHNTIMAALSPLYARTMSAEEIIASLSKA
jgi:nicotinamidase-related amidase